ncbi:hypothetical protein [Amycolatopsis pigmentata]|uniref:Helix-turn-helix domain-containing protein n=1 Tax=Amycolatopsis pigmentata TaxID=450801 RepID=A0ABW5G3P9_9PSEU
MTRRRWGKAGVPLTAQEAANIGQRQHQRQAADEAAQRETYRAWRSGCVSPWRITAALDLRDLYGPEVDEACGVTEPAVDMWEAGQLYPTWEQLLALAELTHFPPGFFVLGGEPIPIDATSLLCGLIDKQLAEWKRDHTEPVLEFLPEAITATVEEADHAHQLPPVRPGHPPRRPRPDETQAAPQVRAASRRHADRPRGERVRGLRNAEAVDVVTREEPRLDRTGDPEPPQPHVPGIDCAPGGWLRGHTLDDDQPIGCPVCRPWLRPEKRQEQIWGGNPDARPQPADPSSVATRPSEIGAEQK